MESNQANPYDLETEAMEIKFRTLFVELATTATDSSEREQRSHTLTAMVRAMVETALNHLGPRPESVAWLVNEELKRAMRARSLKSAKRVN